MPSYLLINLTATILAILARNKRLGFCFFLSLGVLCIFYAIRYDLGNDYWSYYETFLQSKWGYDPEGIEFGWWAINYFLQPLGYFGLIIVTTIFNYSSIYYFISKYVNRNYWGLSVFIFCFTFNFQLLSCSMMRQFMAMVIMLYAIKPILDKNLIKFSLILALAFLIHKTSIIFVPMFLFGLKIPQINRPFWIILFVGIFVGLLSIAIVYIDIFQYASILFEDEKFSRYIDNGDEGSFSFTIIFDILWMILLMKYFPNNGLGKIICIISLCAYIIMPFSFVVVMLVRLMLFYSIFFIFSIPNMFEHFGSKYLGWFLITIYSLLMLRRTYTSINGDTYGDYYESFRTIFSAPNWL